MGRGKGRGQLENAPRGKAGRAGRPQKDASMKDDRPQPATLTKSASMAGAQTIGMLHLHRLKFLLFLIVHERNADP